MLHRIEDLLQWKAKEQRVNDLVSLDRVRGLLQTIFWRKRFLDHRVAVRAADNTGTQTTSLCQS